MAWDETWEKIYCEREWGQYPGEDLIRFVARNFYSCADRSEVKILEVGCGAGANIWYMAREGFSVYGIDGSKTAIEKTMRRLDQEVSGWSGELLVGDIATLPFEDNYFDAVIDNEAITHNSFDDSKKIYFEVSRVLKKEGKLFSRTFSTSSWGDKTGENVGRNAWIVNEGPMDLGEYIRFTPFEDISQLIPASMMMEKVEELSWTLENRNHVIKEWLIHAVKL